MRIVAIGWLFLASWLMLNEFARGDVTVEKSDRGAVVKIDGEVFTEYLTKAGQSPALWPVIGPTGKEMTRAWPIRQPRKGEISTDDHPHHQSVWFTHDKVNGTDFWYANVSDSKEREGVRIAHREFKEIASEGDTARIVTVNDWMNGGNRICEDTRTLVFGTRKNGDRWIDFTVTIKAADGDVTFGDTKEGTFAVRVADAMRVDAKLGGKITNSEGLVNEAAWGLPARWVDYTGPVEAALRDAKVGAGDGATRVASESTPIVGIAMMSHPSSFRPVPRWHVRTYGLFTANPFGEHDFPAHEAADQGAFTIKKGDSLTLRYRILLHEGTTDVGEINQAFEEFSRN